MKKWIALLLIVLCFAGMFGCNKDKVLLYEIHLTIPAGSSGILWHSELLSFQSGNVTVHADYKVQSINTLALWLADTGIEHASEGNPYTNAVIPPNTSIEQAVDSRSGYKLGISLASGAEDHDIPVVITIYQ